MAAPAICARPSVIARVVVAAADAMLLLRAAEREVDARCSRGVCTVKADERRGIERRRVSFMVATIADEEKRLACCRS